MGRSTKKPRKNKMDPQRVKTGTDDKKAAKEKDWSFEDIVRSKTRRR